MHGKYGFKLFIVGVMVCSLWWVSYL